MTTDTTIKKSNERFPDAMPRPWTAEVGDRLSDGGDCWVIDSEIGSVAEMQCGIDREGQTAKLIVAAVNSYDALVKAIEAEAARRAYHAGLGVSEWKAFLWPEARAALVDPPAAEEVK